jgi:hypothetical protein
MAEYIKRETAVKAANEWVSEACMAPVMRVSRLLDKLQKVPAADVAQVVHGRWMKRRNGGTLCSRCGHYTQHKGNVLDMSEAIACPWCGAIMDGGADHEAD